MEQHKTDASVKAGLQLETDTNPVKRKRKRIPLKRNLDKETDGVETLPAQGFEAMTDHDEDDMDELVHSRPPEKTVTDNEGQDADDLVHGK